MLTTFTDPFDSLFRLQRELEARLASDWLLGRGARAAPLPGVGRGGAPAGAGAFPPINVFRQGHDFVALIEMPGVSKDDITLEAKEGTIRVSGRKIVDYGDQFSVHRRERVAGSFDRTITLPVRIDPDGIKAECRDGILALFIPRAESDKPRSIKIYN
mgnify:CR=1 FL=1